MKRTLTSPAGWPNETLQAVVRSIQEVHGQDLARYDETFLARSLARRQAATAAATPADYAGRMAEDRAEGEALIRSLDIHHSELFRDPLSFALLEQRILPALAARKADTGPSELRVWSAGCAAGQEACSVAILLRELAEVSERAVSYRIFATDTSEAQLALGRAGVFDEAAMGKVRWAHVERWFARQGRSFAAAPELRERTDFSVYDLLDEQRSCPPSSIFGGFDLILCCNLLFYYRPEGQRLILDKLRRCLAVGGFLVTGDAERELVKGAGFQPVFPSAAIFRRAGHS
jgi:chemotaxis methyl-accepting protein methylase